ncbi:MAG: hypothetical protein K2N23_03995 [Clostridia bacterium]|nr:hypothetical protein [Clostridia bacterium]
MKNKNTNVKEIVIAILILLCGVAFTVTSFCITYIVKPQNPAVLIIMCVCDFIYGTFTTCAFFKYMDLDIGTHKWLLKGVLASVVYIVAFTIVGIIFVAIKLKSEFVVMDMLAVLVIACFTAPSIFIVVALVLLFLMGAS